MLEVRQITDTAPPGAVLPTSAIGGGPEADRNQFHPARIFGPERIAMGLGALHRGGSAPMQSGRQPAVSADAAADQRGLRLALATAPNTGRQGSRYLSAGEFGAERGSDSGTGWSYASRHRSGSIVMWPHGSRASRGVLQRDRSAHQGTPHVNGVVKSFAPTRIRARGEVNNPCVHHHRSRFDTLRTHRAWVRLKLMPSRENNALPVRRRPNDVPEPRSVRYSHMRWSMGAPADVRGVPHDAIDVGRPRAGGVHHWFGPYVLQHAPVNQRLICCAFPGGDFHGARRSSRSISLIGRPGACAES